MLRLPLLILSSLLAISAFASEIRYDKTRAFIKLKENGQMPQTHLITKSTHLFGQNYLVRTSNVDELQSELKNNSQIIRIEKNYYAEKSKLPKVEQYKSTGPELNFSAFNDPLVGKVWAFQDATKNGISINKSYLAPLSLQKEEIIVAVVNHEATVKRFYKPSAKNKKIELRPANSDMESFWYEPGEVDVRGIVVGLIRKY